MASPAAVEPGLLVILVRWRAMAKVDSMVILSLLINQGCDLGCCVEGSVLDAAA